MRGTRRVLRAFAALAAAGLLAGCASPIGIRIADPQEVQRYLTRSALTDQRPSDFSLNELRRYDLLKTYDGDPDPALAKLHAAALAEGLPPAALFALAELSFLRGQKTKLQASYAAAAVYAYAHALPRGGERIARAARPPRAHRRGSLQPCTDLRLQAHEAGHPRAHRQRRGRTAVRSRRRGVLARHVPDARERALRLPAGRRDRSLGLRNRYRRPGIGAPLAAKTRPLPGAVPVVPVPPLDAGAAHRRDPDRLAAGGTAHGRPARPGPPLRGPRHRGDRDRRPQIPLEAEPTAALAASLAESQFWKRELQAFLGNAIGVRKETALFGLRPYRAGRIPVVFVHGTASSPARWADMVSTTCSPTRACAIATRSGSSPTIRAIRSPTPPISSATRSRRRWVAPTRTAAIPARATWW